MDGNLELQAYLCFPKDSSWGWHRGILGAGDDVDTLRYIPRTFPWREEENKLH